MAQNKRALSKFDSMTKEQKLEYMATARRVTVGTITQMIDTTPGRAIFKKSYVPKIRGLFVGKHNDYKFDTVTQAHAAGLEMLNGWRKQYAEKKGTDKP